MIEHYLSTIVPGTRVRFSRTRGVNGRGRRFSITTRPSWNETTMIAKTCSLRPSLPRRHHPQLCQYFYSSQTTSTPPPPLPVPLRPFQIEQYEGWLAPHGCLSDSDAQPISLSDVLALADDECRILWETLSLGYPRHVTGDPLLRVAILQHHYPNLAHLVQEEEDDTDNTVKNTNDSNGAVDCLNCMAPQEGIFCALHALLQPGDHVIVTAPAYQSLSEIPRSIGCHVSHWLPELVTTTTRTTTTTTTTLPSSSSPYFRFNPDTLRALLQQKQQQQQQQQQQQPHKRLAMSSSSTKFVVVVNFPHNPTGALPTLDEWKQMIEICRTYGCYLFNDELYRGLEHDGIAPLPPAVEAYEKGISLGGLSKSYGLAGLRLGWIASRDRTEFLPRVQQIKDFTTIVSPAPSQLLGLVAVRNTDTLVTRNQQLVQALTREVQDFCDRHDSLLEWTTPRAGTFCFPKLLPQSSLSLSLSSSSSSSSSSLNSSSSSSSQHYCKELLRRSGMMLLPSSLFEYGKEHSKDDTRVRISLGRTSIPELLTQWEAHIRLNPY
jgi:aspartate/methionine/tyrosine aminotransferase